jgi:hypothetical protein
MLIHPIKGTTELSKWEAEETGSVRLDKCQRE